jgi:hypothetical protein
MKILLKITLLLLATLYWTSILQGQSWSAPNLDQNTYRNGSVGIGLTTPQAKLHLSKTTQESGISTGDPIPTISSYYPHVRFNNFVEKGGQVIGSNVWDMNALNNFSLATISGSTGFPSLKMSLSDQGNVNFYGDKLALGDGYAKFTLGKGNSLFGGAAYHIGFGIAQASGQTNGTFFNFGGTGGAVIQGDTDGNILFISKEDDGDATIGVSENLEYTKMIIKGNGQVLIGTNDNPAFLGSSTPYKLYINGGAMAKEFVARTGWGDYVFEKNYNLLSLEKVEEHIEENGHLHNTPPAKEIETNGLPIGKMMVNQQVKIEEIFLHLIEINKKIDALEEENQQLKEELENLKNE